MREVISDTIWDVIKLLPFLFLAYLAMEYMEHRMGEKAEELVGKAGRFGPVIGGLLGIVPQCGFSAAASNLYAGRVITLGTLIAVFLSTSDEMLPILISEQTALGTILGILIAKAAIGIVAGMLLDFALRRKKVGKMIAGGSAMNGTASGKLAADRLASGRYAADRLAAGKSVPGKSVQIKLNPVRSDLGDQDHMQKRHIRKICEHEHCGCEKGIFRSAVSHTAQIALFILLITFALNLALFLVGEEALARVILNRPIAGPLLAGLVGLIPNCAGSVVITQLYLEGVLSMGSTMAGLLTGSGVGLLVLFRVNHDKKENMKLLALLYGIGALVGMMIEMLF